MYICIYVNIYLFIYLHTYVLIHKYNYYCKQRCCSNTIAVPRSEIYSTDSRSHVRYI